MKTLNLTQHPATAEQIQAGVIEPKDKEAARLLLTFSSLPTEAEVKEIALALTGLVLQEEDKQDFQQVMLGGAPFLMHPLHTSLSKWGFDVVYAFSERVSEEKVVDGEVIKTSAFRHVGFV